MRYIKGLARIIKNFKLLFLTLYFDSNNYEDKSE